MWNSVRVEYKADTFDTRRYFSQKLEPFGCDNVNESRKSGNVSAGSAQARNQTTADWVSQRRKYYWDARSFPSYDFCNLVSAGHNNARRHADQFSCKDPSFFGVATSPAIIDPDIAAF